MQYDWGFTGISDIENWAGIICLCPYERKCEVTETILKRIVKVIQQECVNRNAGGFVQMPSDADESGVEFNTGWLDSELLEDALQKAFIVVDKAPSRDKGFEPVAIIVDEFKDFPIDPVGCAKVIVENVKQLLRRIHHYEEAIGFTLQNVQGFRNRLQNALDYKGEMLQEVKSFEERITKQALEILHPMQEVKTETQKPHDIKICKDCGNFNDDSKCPQKIPTSISCPAAVPMEPKAMNL